MRGKKFSRVACHIIENAPAMTACDAMSVAIVASMIIGICRASGNMR